jgi:3-hydroxyacyl-CoA dehydrogenase
MADRIGLAAIVARLEHHGRTRGNAFGYWTVSPLLASLAREGRRLSDWTA